MTAAETDTPRLPRRDLATRLTARGFPITENTLRKKARDGSGPPYQIFGARALYDWEAALAWARGRLREPSVRAA